MLQDTHLLRKNLPIKYLGLPLTIRSIKRTDIQPLIDKAAAKLSTLDMEWEKPHTGRPSLPHKGCPVVSTDIPACCNKTTKKALEEIDTIRRCFLWAANQ